MVELRLGHRLDPSDIREGNDVYFECVVNANPPAKDVTWFHNVSKIYMNF